ncbi:rhodanese-like domain-containing protein [Gordonia sp. CPCC 206044]|uniref:sulfurtransferase n=1 Tax=Gordonia sp. CPCC 206044 TaxID=3140793 RepID=UPI003AF3FDC6
MRSAAARHQEDCVAPTITETKRGDATVVSTQWLEEHLHNPLLAVVEITDDPSHIDERGTIPGATAVYWKHLLWHQSRRELVSATELSDRLLALGAGRGSIVVFAGEPTQFAAYAIWVSRVAGIAGTLHYLDGGLDAWRHAHADPPNAPQPIRDHQAALAALAVTDPDLGQVIDRNGVRERINSETVIVDLRSPEEFAGVRVAPATEPIDHGAQRHGRIPGARPLHVRELLDEHGRILPTSALQERISGLDAEEVSELVFYCRLSHRAALGWLIFTDVLGDPRVRVYDGSWTEWGSIVGTPIER